MQLDLFATDVDEKIYDTFIRDLKRGSSFVDGKERIYEIFTQKLPKTETIDLLKNEYGTGGMSNGVYNQWHDSKGIKISLDLFDEDQSKLYTWSQVYDALAMLIETGEYFRKGVET